MRLAIERGKNGVGLRWARLGEWRLLAHADGGYSVHRLIPGIGWCLLHDDDLCPPLVEGRLCAELGIEMGE
jgi:hypothetical protein